MYITLFKTQNLELAALGLNFYPLKILLKQ